MSDETFSDNLAKGIRKAAILVIAAICLLAVWAGSPAVAGPSNRNMGRRPMPPIASRMRLSPDQKSNILQAWQNVKKQAQQLRQSRDLTPDQKQEGIQTLKRQMQDQVNQILTPDQRQKLLQYRQEMQGQDRVRTTGPGAAPNMAPIPGARKDMGDQQLTPQQRQHLQSVRQQMRQQDNR